MHLLESGSEFPERGRAGRVQTHQLSQYRRDIRLAHVPSPVAVGRREGLYRFV
jgi:hypothetical protein